MTDYVDRNKVLSGEEFFGEHATWDNPMTEGCLAVRSDFIMNLPAADVVKVVHANWEWDPDGIDWGIGAWKCSNCGSKAETWWAKDGNSNPLKCAGSHYCGNCGAVMRR